MPGILGHLQGSFASIILQCRISTARKQERHRLIMPCTCGPHQCCQFIGIARIDIDARNGVSWNGKAVADRAALDALLQQAKAQEPQPELHIKAQAKAKYEAVAGVLASAQRQGLTKIGVVGTEQFAAP